MIEIFWTGMGSLLKGDYRLTSTSSIWMFFIYGLAVFLEPLLTLIIGLPFYFRGGIYVMCFFAIEYVTGHLLTSFKLCPWDYSAAKYNVRGIIRLDYAPAWFAAGFLFEGLYRLLV